jgi:hypothetical protein
MWLLLSNAVNVTIQQNLFTKNDTVARGVADVYFGIEAIGLSQALLDQNIFEKTWIANNNPGILFAFHGGMIRSPLLSVKCRLVQALKVSYLSSAARYHHPQKYHSRYVPVQSPSH